MACVIRRMFRGGKKLANIMKVWTAKRLWQQLEKSVLVKINGHSIEARWNGWREKRNSPASAYFSRNKSYKNPLSCRSKEKASTMNKRRSEREREEKKENAFFLDCSGKLTIIPLPNIYLCVVFFVRFISIRLRSFFFSRGPFYPLLSSASKCIDPISVCVRWLKRNHLKMHSSFYVHLDLLWLAHMSTVV